MENDASFSQCNKAVRLPCENHAKKRQGRKNPSATHNPSSNRVASQKKMKKITFSVTNTRRRPSFSTLSARVAHLRAEGPQPRHDLAEQAGTANKHRAALSDASHQALAHAKDSALWDDPKTAAHTVLLLLNEAMRYDMELAARNKGAARKLCAAWRAIIKEVKGKTAARRTDDAGSLPQNDAAREIMGVISAQGLWFSDLPSPAIARRPQAILSTYYSYSEGVDARPYLRALDALACEETGRAQLHTAGIAADTCLTGGANEHERSVLRRVAASFPVARPALELTPFVAQSRELRQLVTLRLLGGSGAKFVMARDQHGNASANERNCELPCAAQPQQQQRRLVARACQSAAAMPVGTPVKKCRRRRQQLNRVSASTGTSGILNAMAPSCSQQPV